MRDLEAKHPSLKRVGEFSPSCRPRYNRGLRVGDEGTRAKHPSLQRGGRVQPLLQAQVYNRAEEWEMRDLEAKHPSLKRGGEFSTSWRPMYNRGCSGR